LNAESPRKAPRLPKRLSPVSRLLVTGRKIHNGPFSVYWSEKETRKAANPFLIVGKKALALASDRNRAKRLAREIYRLSPLTRGKDLLIAIRISKRPEKLTMSAFKEGLDPILERIFK
jgi:ribonuclease P protein component